MTERPQARFKKRKLKLDVIGIDALPDDILAWERELIEPGLRHLLDKPELEAPVVEASDADAS